MYKLLPILLFAFLVAEESTMYLTTEGWEKSDKLIDILEELKPDMDEFNNKLIKLLHPDKFLIRHAFIIIDTTRIENISHDSLMSKITMIENSSIGRFELEMNVSFYKLSDSGNYYEIRTTRYVIEVNVDNSIELDNQIQDMVWMALEAATGLKKEFDPDLLIFNSVDISKFKHNNKQVSLNRDDIYDDSWAVIIGIDKYENLSNLDYAVADAEAVKEMLITKFDYPKENVKLLLNEEANKTNIVNVISNVSLKAGENDRILVFYAGHGETMPLPDGGEMGYLVPIDGKQENLLASAIPMDDLKRFSNVSKAKHMLFLVDACYGGLAAVGSRGLEPAKTPNYIEKISKIKSRQIITAGGKDEKVFEKSEWGHSAYTKNLLSALEDGLADSNEDGYITADELGDYLSEKVSIDSENQQTPQSRRLTSHEGEFVFFSNHNAINQNVEDKSADAKLDYLISEMEELKSQKSSGDDKVVEKTAERQNIWEDWNIEGSRGFFITKSAYGYGIGYFETLWGRQTISIGYSNTNSNEMANLFSIPESLSMKNRTFWAEMVVNINYERIQLGGQAGLAYVIESWKNTAQNTSGELQAIYPGGGVGFTMHPFAFKRPFPMNISIQFSVAGSYRPRTYQIYSEGLATKDDWQFKVNPEISVIFIFPKNKSGYIF